MLEESGTYAKPSPNAIAQGVLELVGSPDKQEELSQAARLRAREHYSWAEVCRRYESSLAELADGRSATEDQT